MNNHIFRRIVGRQSLPAWLLMVSLTMATAGVGFAQLEPSTPAFPSNGLHPAIVLRDADGVNVLESTAAISPMQTCGTCHDTAFIASHSVHVDVGQRTVGTVESDRAWQTGVGWYGGWNPITYAQPQAMPVEDWLRDYGWRHVGGGVAESVGTEMNCFTCHADAAGNTSRIEALAAEQFAWVTTATLAHTALVSATDDGWTYNPDAFNADGTVSATALTLGEPSNDNCLACHGAGGTDTRAPLVFNPDDPTMWHTQVNGEVFAAEHINASGMNVANKSELTRAWDVHAERVVACTDCHYSLNNPVFYVESEAGRPDHLKFDPRRMTFEDYLTRPLHQFANGGGDYVGAFPVFENATRDCATCHDAESTHTWLPYADQHLTAMACETCHVPQLHAPALAAIDWTTVDPDGQPVRQYRGLESEAVLPFLTGYQPVILASDDNQLAPYNLISAWYWVAGDPVQPIPQSDLIVAFSEAGAYRPDVLAAFDADSDGQLTDTERLMDTDAKAEIIREQLIALGYDAPHIMGETDAYPVHHGVTNGEWVTHECQSCHQADSRLTQPMTLTGTFPGGVTPTFIGAEVNGEIHTDAHGLAVFTPLHTLQPVDIYIFGRDAVAWIDWAGILLLLGVMGGVTVHGGLRVILARRTPKPAEAHLRQVYMYSIYERQWHWLQTAVIFGLLFTGLVMHKPVVFPLFKFRWLVRLHNALAWILIINAALAAFYHLASGQIRQFIPAPRGFFGQMYAQARYYLWGIFRNEPHPLQKTHEHKMNPIQQVTYLVLLNVLLPAQVISGLLIWGRGYAPDWVNAVGGLPLLAPIHSLISWLMASFIVLHVYMTTTGHEPLTNIHAMMFGWDEVEDAASDHPTQVSD